MGLQVERKARLVRKAWYKGILDNPSHRQACNSVSFTRGQAICEA